MSALRYASLLALAAPLLSACRSEQPLDHFWDHDHCGATVHTPDGQTQASGVTAYLRRENGSSGLVVQLDEFGGGINDPYLSGPATRFAVPRDVAAPATLTVTPDTSDLRGPVAVAPGTAWLITTPKVDTSLPGDDWRFGSGTMTVSTMAIAENDTPDRDFVSFEGAFDLSGVQAKGIAADATPAPVYGAVLVRCADDLVAGDAGAGPIESGPGDAASEAPLADAGPDAADDAPVACGQSGSCANPLCGDCNASSADFCETDLRTTDHCGACTRSCGAGGSCDPLGACVGTSVASQAASAVTIGPQGVGYLVPGVPGTGAVRFAPTGAAAADAATGFQFSTNDAIALDGSDLWFASYAGITHVTVPGGVASTPFGANLPDGIRLVGLGPAYAYTLSIGEGSPAHDVLRRIDRAVGTITIIACMPIGTYDAAVDLGTQTAFVSFGTQIVEYTGTMPGLNCTASSTGTTYVNGGTNEAIVRLVASSTRLVWIASPGGSTGAVRSQAIGGSVVTHGTAGSTSSGSGWPLAAVGDVAFWVDGTPGAAPGSRTRILAGDGVAPPTPLAVAGAGVTSLSADATDLAWAEPSGVFRIAR